MEVTQIKSYSVSDTTFIAPISSDYYAANSLYKNITTDEAGHQVIEFKDKRDHIVLKKVQLTATVDNGTGRGHTGCLCTDYIYDDFSRLRCVIQPTGIDSLRKTNWTLNTTRLHEQPAALPFPILKRPYRLQLPVPSLPGDW